MAISGTTSASIDVASIVSQLMQVERQPLARLDNRVDSYKTRLSAYGALSNAVSSFRGAISGLTTTTKLLGMSASAADSSVLSASADASATPGSHSIEVTRLASGQKLAASGQSSVDTPLGAGSLTLDFGTISGGSFNSASGTWSGATFTPGASATQTIVIDAANSSLAGIRDTINAANAGVTAALVNDGGTSPWRLVLSGNTTGAAQSMRIGVTGAAPLQALLAHDPAGAQSLAEKTSAADAALLVDGIAISKASNTITDVLEGVTLTLAKTNSGSPTTLTIGRDTSSALNQAKAFVDSVNAMLTGLRTIAGYDSATKTTGALYGDSTTASLNSRLRTILNGAISGAGSITSLSQLGIAFQRDGSIKLDAAKFSKALANNPGDVAAAFASTARPSDSLVKWDSSSARTVAGDYALQITQMATRGELVGTASANLTIVAGVNDSLDVTLDGLSSTITLTAGSYADADALAREVATRINGATAFSSEGAAVTVSQSAGVLTLRSERYGATSALTLTGGNGALDLLGASPTATAGQHVAGTLGGLAALGNGQLLTGIGGSPTDGLNLRITGGSAGARGTVSVAKGIAWQLDQLAANMLDAEGAIAARTDGLSTTLDSLAAQRLTLQSRLAVIEDRYRRQYAALDGILTRMQATQNYLTGQLEALANLTSNRN